MRNQGRSSPSELPDGDNAFAQFFQVFYSAHAGKFGAGEGWAGTLDEIIHESNLDQSTMSHRAPRLAGGMRVKAPDLPARISVHSYFHSQTLEVVAPAASTSYSKAPQVEPSEIFWELVRKNNMPR